MIRPRWTLSEVYGHDTVLNPLPSFDRPGYLSRMGTERLTMFSAAKLSVAGGIPVICNTGVISDRTRTLYRTLGYEWPEAILEFDSPRSYQRLLKTLESGDQPVAFQYPHGPEEFDSARYWVDRDLLVDLNNKGNLARWVPPEHVPQRDVLPLAELTPDHPLARELPVVVKAATHEPTGSGAAVCACRTPEELESIQADFFVEGETIVVESFIRMEQNLCVQFITTSEGQIRYLGTAEQVVDEQMDYHGNWLDADGSYPRLTIEVGREIMGRAVEEGYRGVAGFDMAVCPDGRVYVFDLNFRFNGSTIPLLFLDSVADRLNRRLMRTRQFLLEGPFGHTMSVVSEAFDRGTLLPTGLLRLDPSDHGRGESLTMLASTLGNTREEVKRNEVALAAEGVVPKTRTPLKPRV